MRHQLSGICLLLWILSLFVVASWSASAQGRTVTKTFRVTFYGDAPTGTMVMVESERVV